MQTHNLEHKYKIAFEIIKRICHPRIESGKNYTQISVQELISYMDYEAGKDKYERKGRVIPFAVVEEVRGKRYRDELTDEDIKKICEETQLSESQIRSVIYQDFSQSQL